MSRLVVKVAAIRAHMNSFLIQIYDKTTTRLAGLPPTEIDAKHFLCVPTRVPSQPDSKHKLAVVFVSTVNKAIGCAAARTLL